MSDDDYKVGDKRPPKEYQWPKGVSGNLKGRPKGSKNLRTMWRKEFLEPSLTVNDNGKPRKICKFEMALKVLAAEVAKGKIPALHLLLESGAPHLEADDPANPAGAPDDEKIIDLFMNRSRTKPDTGGNDG